MGHDRRQNKQSTENDINIEEMQALFSDLKFNDHSYYDGLSTIICSLSY
jgi:hypothetical protein